jgi:hypothetical protein
MEAYMDVFTASFGKGYGEPAYSIFTFIHEVNKVAK